MKRKGLFFSTLIVIITVLGVVIIACDEKEKDGNDNVIVTYNGNLIGTWKGTSGGETYTDEYTFTFNSDGTGTYVKKFESSYSGNGTIPGTLNFVMSSDKGGIMITKRNNGNGEGDEDSYCFVVDNDKLFVVEADNDGIVLSKNSGEGSVGYKKYIVGTWNGTTGGTTYTDEYTFTFNSDGTGSYLRTYESSYSGNGTEPGTLKFVMSSDKGGIMITKRNNGNGEGDEDPYCFAVDNDKLYVLGADDWVVLSKNSGESSVGDKKYIVGTWKGTSGGETYTDEYTFTFNSDGTGTYVKNFESSYSGNGTEPGTLRFVMSSDKGGIMITKRNNGNGEGDEDSYCFAIDNDKLYVVEVDDYVILSKQ